jgi:hypothetical protein
MRYDEGFTVINMDEFHQRFWQSVIGEFKDKERATR